MCQIIRGKELPKHVGIHIESKLHNSIFPQGVAQKYLGQNVRQIPRKYNLELEDIRIGQISSIPPILILIMSLLVYGTHFIFHANIYSSAEAPVYFHPSPMENGIPSAPWGYFSHDPNPTPHEKDSLMEPDFDTSYDRYDAYRSTLTGVDAVV